MLSSRKGSGRWASRRGLMLQAGLAVLGLVTSTGCQVEYAGMTLPSGKYFHDDVQYFPPGPEFPYANTQAATQRARMQAMGMEPPPPPGLNGPGGFGAPGGGPAGMPQGPAAVPRLNAAPEAENLMPGGPSAPNPAVPTPPVPGVAPGAPGGNMPAPTQP